LNAFQLKFINQRRIGKYFFPEYCKITFNGNINHIEDLKPDKIFSQSTNSGG